MRRCSVDECNRQHRAMGYCHMHYNRWRLRGTTDLTPSPRRVRERATVDAQPLLGYLRRHGQPVWMVRAVSEAAYRQVYRCGRISEGDADAIACALGVHPMDIWDNWFEVAA